MRDEIFTVVGSDSTVRMSNKNGMPYCCAAIMEIQRKASILKTNLAHRTLSDACVSGIRIPSDTKIIPQISSVMADPLFFKNPEVFDPTRFLNEDGKTFKKVRYLFCSFKNWFFLKNYKLLFEFFHQNIVFKAVGSVETGKA